MKKNRNTFFNEANFSQSSYMGNPPMGGGMPMNGAYGSTQASQSFYSGPSPMMQNMPQNQMYNPMGSDLTSDFESRMAKLERQINRLDARISKLESLGISSTDTAQNTTNMYML